MIALVFCVILMTIVQDICLDNISHVYEMGHKVEKWVTATLVQTLSDDKILALSKMKAFAVDYFSIA